MAEVQATIDITAPIRREHGGSRFPSTTEFKLPAAGTSFPRPKQPAEG